MPESLELNFESTSKRFGWHLLGNSVGFVRDLAFLAGDVIAKTGNWVIRFGEILGSGGKEMYKLALKIRERQDHSDGTAGTGEEDVTTGEKVALYALTPFIGYQREDGWYVPGLLTAVIRGVEWAIKTPGIVLWFVGEGVRTLGRLAGYGRDKLNDNAPITDQEKHLRAAEHDYIGNVKAAFSKDVVQGNTPALIPYDRQDPDNDGRTFPRIYTLALLSLVKQVALLLALPGRLVNWVGRAFSKANLLISSALMAISRFGESTFLEYARNLHAARGSMNGFQEGAAVVLIGVTGAVGLVLTYVPKFLSFINNLYTGIPGFILENAGKLLSWPGMALYGLAQRFAPDVNQIMVPVDFDILEDIRDDSEARVDAKQVLAVKAKLYKTFVRDVASEKSALNKGLEELRARFDLYVAKAGVAKSEEAATLAKDSAHGALATVLMGYYYGYGEGHGQYPLANDPILDALKADEVCGDRRMELRKPELTQGIFSYWTKRSALARAISHKVVSIDGADMTNLGLQAASNTRNDGFTEKDRLLGSAKKLLSI